MNSGRSACAGRPGDSEMTAKQGVRALRSIDVWQFERPVRRLLAGQLLASTGAGMLTTGTVVYLVRSVGLDAEAVGVGLTVAAILSFLPLPVAGALLDRYGGRTVGLVAGVVASLATTGFVGIGS